MSDQIVLLSQNGGIDQLLNAEPLSNMEQEVFERRDIILENDINNQRYCIPSLDVKFKHGTEYSLDFTHFIDKLKKISFPVYNCMLFCWDQKREMHVFVANDPMTSPHYLPANIFGTQGNIYIKFRALQSPQQIAMQQEMMKRMYASPKMEEEHLSSQQSQAKKTNNSRQSNVKGFRGRCQSVVSNQIKEEDNQSNNMLQAQENLAFSQFGNTFTSMEESALPKVEKKKKKMMNNPAFKGSNNNNGAPDKRVKERYIEKVREKVSEWRAMHEIGVPDKDGILQKINLDHAANQLGISRKTMDDYYLQLRRAEQLGFDFEKNKSEKMGTLRKFVKDQSTRQGNPSSSNLQNVDDSAELDQETSSQAEATVTNVSNNTTTASVTTARRTIQMNPFGIVTNNSTIDVHMSTNMRGSSNNISNVQPTSLPTMIMNLGNQNQQQLSQIMGTNSINATQTGLIGPSFSLSNIESTGQLITPYNLASTIGGGVYRSSSQQFRQSSGQYCFTGRGSSYMAQEPNIEIGQRNSNSMQFNSQIFNPGSQFLGQQQNGSIVANQSIMNGEDHSLGNIIINESMNQSKIHQNEQNRFSNHFSLISFGNNSHFTDERGSINFMSHLPSNLQNISHIEDRQSKGDVMQSAEDNYITTSVHLPPNSNNNSMLINQ